MVDKFLFKDIDFYRSSKNIPFKLLVYLKNYRQSPHIMYVYLSRPLFSNLVENSANFCLPFHFLRSLCLLSFRLFFPKFALAALSLSADMPLPSHTSQSYQPLRSKYPHLNETNLHVIAAIYTRCSTANNNNNNNKSTWQFKRNERLQHFNPLTLPANLWSEHVATSVLNWSHLYITLHPPSATTHTRLSARFHRFLVVPRWWRVNCTCSS